MRRWVLNLHLYLSLLCAPYLLIFGISSLQFNHQFAFMKAGETQREWEKPLSIPPVTNSMQSAEAVRDALGMIGWPLPWEMRRDNSGNLHFGLEHPGKSYKVHALVSENKVRVEERSKGFWPVLNSLHGLMTVPRSRWAAAWGIYTDLCTFTVLFAVISGIYLWASSKRERRVGLTVLGAALTLSLGFIFYVIWRG